MSCAAVLKLKVFDLLALKYAGEELGLVMREAETYKPCPYLEPPYPLGLSHEEATSCNYALSIPDNKKAFEVGVKLMPDGSYALLHDPMAGGYGLEDVIGKDGLNLIRGYEAWAYKNLHPGAVFNEYQEADGTRVIEACYN